jgi:hypothetical protein
MQRQRCSRARESLRAGHALTELVRRCASGAWRVPPEPRSTRGGPRSASRPPVCTRAASALARASSDASRGRLPRRAPCSLRARARTRGEPRQPHPGRPRRRPIASACSRTAACRPAPGTAARARPRPRRPPRWLTHARAQLRAGGYATERDKLVTPAPPIARELNACGLRTNRGNPRTPPVVRDLAKSRCRRGVSVRASAAGR